MVKKIKNIQQLNAEKKQLAQRKVELEKAIKYDWRDVKESLKPGNVAGQVFSKLAEGKQEEEGNSFFADALAKMAARFTGKMAEKAENKIGKWFKRSGDHS